MPGTEIAVIAGGRDHNPTLFELDQIAEVIARRGVKVARLGACPSRKIETPAGMATMPSADKAVAAFIRARGLATVEEWPAKWDDHGRSAGPRRNRAMLDGAHREWSGETREPAGLMITMRGGRGTADCTGAALERGLPTEWIVDADEPRPWNRHHGPAPGREVYVGRGTPLGNPFRLDARASRAEQEQEILAQYRGWLWSRIKPGGRRMDPRVVEALESIEPTDYLVCSCWPRRCHAELIIAAWRWSSQPQSSGS